MHINSGDNNCICGMHDFHNHVAQVNPEHEKKRTETCHKDEHQLIANKMFNRVKAFLSFIV